MRLAMLGVSHPRLGGERLATGRGRFVADVRPEGLLEAAVLRSPHAHARVLRVAAARPLRLPGLPAVLTAADVAAVADLQARELVAVPPDPRGGELHLIGSTKCIHINRRILAQIFGIPPGALRLTEVDVGGGFGVASATRRTF